MAEYVYRFELTGQEYLIVMDYYSRFLKILSLMEIKSQTVIQKLKSGLLGGVFQKNW